MGTRAAVGFVLAIGLGSFAVGCGGDDDGSLVSPTTAVSGVTTATSGTTGTTVTEVTTGDGPIVAPPSSAPDPAPARECTGQEVLCVDAAAGADAPDGSAGQPFATVNDALLVASRGTVVQVAAGVYDEPLALNGTDGIRLIGGFPASGDFSQRDAAANPTVLHGRRDGPVVEVVASSNFHIEGFRITGGGGHYDGYNWFGGGVYIDETSSGVAIVDNEIVDNAVDRGDDPSYALGGGIASFGTDVTITANVIDGNRAGRGAGIASIGEATIEGNLVQNNVSVGDHGGGLYLAGDVVVARNHVRGNRVGTDYSWGGGMIVFGDDTVAILSGNVVTDNLAVSAGSGVFVDDGAEATLVGELYYANRCAYDGGQGLLVDSGGQTLTVVRAVNVTIAEHDCPDAALGGNAILAETSAPADPAAQLYLANSILWGNAGRDLSSAGAEVVVTYTLSEEPIDGTGNINADPLFADPAGGDFHLQSAAGRVDPASGDLIEDGESSPAIDAGDPSSPFDAEPDPNGGRIDLGHTGNTSEASRST